MKSLATVLLFLIGLLNARAESLTRGEALAIAEQYATYKWEASEQNVLHGTDRSKVVVSTPNREKGASDAGDDRLWTVGATNIGVPYKWGGFDSLESFAAGVRAGRAAGDLYTAEKRRKGGDAVSPYAVGIDCSGFISRCWKLPRKHSTDTLLSICKPLAAPADLLPGDIMNAAGGHVLLFAKWTDDAKTKALFYEAEPFSKVIASEHVIATMVSAGYRALRYRFIRD